MIVPGPGNYEPSNMSITSRNSAPKYGFGTSDRRAATSHDTNKQGESITAPGPGQYEIKSIIGNDGPMKTLSYRFKIDLTAKEQKLKPGPG